MSRSFEVAAERPFYTSMAEAYDSLVTTPVGPWIEAVEAVMTGSGARGGSLLDAGCGTGRQAAAFVATGHRVTMIDASAELLAIAALRCPGTRAQLADICLLDLGETFDMVTCRGVLNDLIDEDERLSAIERLARHVAANGALVLDVREAGAARKRADGETRRQVVRAGRSELVFESTSTWCEGLLCVDERSEMSTPGESPNVETYQFRMRPWTRQELRRSLGAVGFRQVAISAGVHGAANDRLFVVARR